jgi:hypothetical protein
VLPARTSFSASRSKLSETNLHGHVLPSRRFFRRSSFFLCPSSSQLLLNVWKAPLVDSTAAVLVSALCNGNKIFKCGNGGSAADALHMSEELLGRYKRERAALPATVLSLIQPFLHASAMITGSIIYLHGRSRAWANRPTSSFSSPAAETLSISLKRSKLPDAKSFSQSLFRVRMEGKSPALQIMKSLSLRAKQLVFRRSIPSSWTPGSIASTRPSR